MNVISHFQDGAVYQISKENSHLVYYARYDGKWKFTNLTDNKSFHARITIVSSPRMECAIATGYNAFFSQYDKVKNYDGIQDKH